MTACALLLAAALQVEAPFGKYEIQVPEFCAREFPVTEYGAKSDGTKCTESIAADDFRRRCGRLCDRRTKGCGAGPAIVRKRIFPLP